MYGVGTLVAGKYRIERPLGEGGMGVVVAATHIHLGTPVALKFLHHQLQQNRDVVDRFMREARASAQLRGDNVCRVSDVGVDGNGCPFIVMELLSGQDLGTTLRTTGALPPGNAAEIIMQACVALAEAHQLGIVHRDIKPGNLFWTQRPDGTGCIKVLDFGVAKAPEDIHFSLTQTSSILGSPGYMSPEQLKSSKEVDARSDIWSLGIVLYELVSARKPFTSESITELALRVAMDPTPPLMGAVPPQLESVIARCLEKDPARRFQDVAELASALAPFAGMRGPDLAYAVARVLRGANTPMVPMQGHGANTPTTLRGANGVVTGHRGNTGRNWRLPVVMAGGAAAGIALALVLILGAAKETTASKSNATPSAAGETKSLRMQSATSGSPQQTATSTPPGADTATSANTQSAATEPAKTEAAKTETAKTETAKTETAKTETAKTAETKTTAKTEPAKTEPAKAETAKTDTAKAAETKTTAKTGPAKTDTAKTAETKTTAKTETTAKTSSSKTDTAKTAETKTTAKSETTAKTSSSRTTSTKTTSTPKTTDKPKTTKPKTTVEDLSDSRL